jgi:hypothetical protein
MRAVKAFLLGAVAFGAVTYVFVAALALVVAAGGSTVHLGLGPFVLVDVEHDAGSTTTVVVGSGLLAVALVGGTVNLLAAHVLRRRRDREPIT